VPETLRLLLNFPIEQMSPMSALRLGVNLMRQEFTSLDQNDYGFSKTDVISTDEDSIPMETVPRGEKRAIYEFKAREASKSAAGYTACYHLIAGVSSIAAAIVRIQQGHFSLFEPRTDFKPCR